ncbi:MAG TPA: DUF1206 domain-containing protein [Gemmatirosa sp.]|nr:DUF1206 domain-containing protein [Gemmatirosa sp.]
MRVTDTGARLGQAGAGAARAAGGVVEGAVGEAAPWIERLARVGYAAKAVLYATVGLLAAQAAFGTGGGTTDTRGALRTLLDAPFGRALLAVIALGLVGYGAWRLVDAAVDPSRRGSDAKGLAKRAGIAGSGLLHLALALSAARLAARGASANTGGSGGGQQALTARLLDAPGGRALVALVGAGVIGFGLYQLWRALKAKLGRDLALGELPADTARWAVAISRFGIAARGVVFALVGTLLLRAAASDDARQAAGTEGALGLLATMGRWPLAIVAFGLIAYAGYELLNARYRRIRAG